jgi:hypothetical protein
MNKKTTTSECIRNINEHSASLFLTLLLCADIAFIALHSIEILTPSLENSFYSLEKEGSYPEIYQYIKWFWIIILLAYISTRRRSFSYNAWGLVFTYILFDDALSIHESVGYYITRNLTFPLPLGLRYRDLGELAVLGTAGVILLPFVIWAYVRGSQAFKKMSQDMLLLILALVLFGVVVDIAHISIQLGWKVNEILRVIEDGGEMFIASLILWYVFLLSERDENATSYLFDFVRIVLTRRST